MVTSLAACVLVPLLLVLWSGSGRLQRSPWPAAAVILWYGSHLALSAAANVRAPHEWDYACFWLYGHIAAAHLNVYDPAVFAHFAAPFTPSDEFRAAVLDVGFPYPPPSIALFLPLGFIDSVPVGLAVWYGVQFAALAGAAWVLARTFMPADGWRSALLMLAIIAALPASINTVGDAQTNFLVLLLVALALHARGTASGAVWQTLAIWIKPYTAVLFLLDVVRGHWRRLLVAGLTALLSLIAAALILGPAALANYLRANPSTREPTFAFVEVVNQSLLAIVLRLHGVLPSHVSALHEPLYLAGALIFGAITVALCARTAVSSDVAFTSMLMLGLIVYPGTLTSYGVMLTVPLLVLWKYRSAFPGRTASVAALLAAAVFLQSFSLQRGFAANVLVWIACVYLLLVQRGEVREARPLPARAAGARAAGTAR